MTFNSNIPLMTRQPDFNAISRNSMLTAGAAKDFQHKNALRDVYQEHGAGIQAGDPNAFNALAVLDPQAALRARQAHQQMQFSAERMQMARAAGRRAASAHAAKMSSAEKQKEIAAITAKLKGAAYFYEQGNEAAYNEFLGEAAAQYPFADFPAHASTFKGVLDVLGKHGEMNAPAAPLSGPGRVSADIAAGHLPEGTPLHKPGVTVNTGDAVDTRPMADKPPKGYQRRFDEASGSWVDTPIPGSDASQDRNTTARKLEMANVTYNRKSDIVESNIDKALASLEENGRWVAGYGSLLSGMPESAAMDFNSTLETIKANLGFEELQAMRDSSPTGGALGAISEREIAFLQAIQGNLNAAQSPEQLRDVLGEIKARRSQFNAERQSILSQNQTATTAADIQQQVRGLPDFGGMSDEELDAWIYQNGE